MPVVDDYRFIVKTLSEKLKRAALLSAEVETQATDKNKAMLKAMCDKLEYWYETFSDTMAKISSCNSRTNVEEDLQTPIVEFDANYFQVKGVLASISTADPVVLAEVSNVSNARNPAHNSYLQLPKLKLPEFGGNLKEWLGFAELFGATVHRNPTLSDVQRHSYLRSALHGEALALISSLPLTGTNYTVAWDLLVRHYDNTHLQTHAHLETLFSLPTTSPNPTSIRVFASQLAESIGALKALGHDVNAWVVLLLFICTKKLYNRLREEWESLVLVEPVPSLDDFLVFLHDRARVLEAVQASQSKSSPVRKPSEKGGKSSSERSATSLVVATSNSDACPRCSEPHILETCGYFRQDGVHQRFALVKERKLCMLCLRSGHFGNSCLKSKPCRHCSQRHHSLLHRSQPAEAAHGSSSGSGQVTSYQVATPARGQVIVATAIGKVADRRGIFQEVRLLIDPASQATFITRQCISRLGLSVAPTDVPVLGMGQKSLGICREKVQCRFKPERAVELQLEALVVNFIARAPTSTLQPLASDRILGKKLADPFYFQPRDVDVLLGAEWFGYVMLGRPMLGPPGTPSLMESIWGYCLIGRHGPASSAISSMFLAQNAPTEDASDILRRFWEIEEPPAVRPVKPEDAACEAHYCSTVSRTGKGRYIVALPFLPDHPVLGDSRQAALRRFLSLEKRLNQNAELKTLYCQFMTDYEAQGHMKPTSRPLRSKQRYYIPHHAIFKTGVEGDIRKFRVVFDSSMKTVNGPSLNQILYKGPKLQADIVDILVRFRLFKFVVITDIRQMYRNILVQENDRDFQRILWRSSSELPIQEYQLATITYGVSSSPFLAIRTLQQLVQDEGGSFPLAAQALLEDTYMDDVVKSVDSEIEALTLQKELISLVAKAGFELRKWMSNCDMVMKAVPPEHRMLDADFQSFESDAEPSTKILGLVWKPTTDCFSYQIGSTNSRITKRNIMSDVAKLFDPIGFICPVIFVGKLLLRRLWEESIDWDDIPPVEVVDKWNSLRHELGKLQGFTLPRCLRFNGAEQHELHGFGDSSEKGFAGVVYLRSRFADGNVRLSLMMAKSKVAPLKTCSLPRLELCAIELVTKLLERVNEIFPPQHKMTTTIWSDSMVALHWVRESPHRWKTFVANRVSAIQDRFAPDRFRHVPTDMNPADCASRGLFPSELLQHEMWLPGPQWLAEHPSTWPQEQQVPLPEEDVVEARIVTLLTGVRLEQVKTRPVLDVLSRFSSLPHLLRVVAWAKRFLHNRVISRVKGIPIRSGRLSLTELNEAQVACVRMVQQEAFPKDLIRLKQGKTASLPLRRLAPSLDRHGVLRVGGRLRHSSIPDAQKFPMVLPKGHHFTGLVIDHYHEINLHVGPSALRAILHRHFWILSMQSAILSRLSKCLRCFRSQPRILQPIMGDLPFARVQPGKPFAVTGVDYGGPYEITMSRVRKAKVLKAYICLFVCFKTKAVHLELASDLTTNAFMAALSRFIARRGSVHTIYSDHGTNFVGAKRRMESWTTITYSDEYQEAANRFVTHRNIEWKLIPAGTPHMGGIWEAGIKSTKRLLARTMGEQLLTYEEFYTVLTQVESVLNSRPLTPMSTDPSDLQALTPGHFLFMEPPSALNEPEPSLESNLRDRWSLVCKLVHSFWRRWSADYLNTLQQRNKWTSPAPELREGMLVLIKDDRTSPLVWKLGRIHKLFPGKDNTSRSADVQTANGIISRGTVKLCPLPLE